MFPKFILSSVIRLNFFSRSNRRIRKVTKLVEQTHIYIASEQSTAAEKSKALSEVDLKERIRDLPKVQVRQVIDGDTVIVSQGRWNNTKVRLDSIDCPEQGQYWGDIAKYGLIKLIGGRTAHLEEHGTDSHGRTLATIYVWHEQKNEWLNVNERMVTLGHAWVIRRFYDHLPKDRQDKLNGLERWAKSKQIGLWQAPDPIPPWQWRNEKGCGLN